MTQNNRTRQTLELGQKKIAGHTYTFIKWTIADEPRPYQILVTNPAGYTHTHERIKEPAKAFEQWYAVIDEAEARAKNNSGNNNALLYTQILEEDGTHVCQYTFIPMSNGEIERTPFMQIFINHNTGNRAYWVSDGYYSKKHYKSSKTAKKALQTAIGDLILSGYLPTGKLTGHNARFVQDMRPGHRLNW